MLMKGKFAAQLNSAKSGILTTHGKADAAPASLPIKVSE
jgi:hypothetical protein